MTRDVTTSAHGAAAQGRAPAWELRRMELRQPAAFGAHAAARVEMKGAGRDRVTDIAGAEGAFDAVVAAVSAIADLDLRLVGVELVSCAGRVGRCRMTVRGRRRTVEVEAPCEDVIDGLLAALTEAVNQLSAPEGDAPPPGGARE